MLRCHSSLPEAGPDMRVHPFAEVGKNLFAGLCTVQSFQLGPLLGLRLADETEHNFREDCAVAVEAVGIHRNETMPEQVLLDGDFKCDFSDAAHTVFGVSSAASARPNCASFDMTTQAKGGSPVQVKRILDNAVCRRV
jgi:hypothetical protein